MVMFLVSIGGGGWWWIFCSVVGDVGYILGGGESILGGGG